MCGRLYYVFSTFLSLQNLNAGLMEKYKDKIKEQKDIYYNEMCFQKIPALEQGLTEVLENILFVSIQTFHYQTSPRHCMQYIFPPACSETHVLLYCFCH